MTKNKSDILTESTMPTVWFDLDDTLWDFSNNSLRALRDLYGRRGLSKYWPTAEAWIDDYHAVNAELWTAYAAGEVSVETLRTQRFARPLKAAGYDGGDILSYSADLDADYLRTLCTYPHLIPGARELLESLVGSYRTGILSNGFVDTQPAKLRSGGIDKYVDYMVLSEAEGIAKPDRRIFDRAAAVCGQKPEDCLLVGDNPDTDIRGALNAGWRAIWFNPRRLPLPEYLRDQPRLKVVYTLDEVHDSIENLAISR